jgi:hypothetical protein
MRAGGRRRPRRRLRRRPGPGGATRSRDSGGPCPAVTQAGSETVTSHDNKTRLGSKLPPGLYRYRAQAAGLGVRVSLSAGQ